ncbi:Protoporphyrinogen oxidase [Dendrothele bispora CBS 962.96]|uniref:Protoporphyrinogen oxidase n=1 Tax=Dendrothele bispora (strain CBS 962.96) TaxID=1314807 RepID=A0A4S8MP29_DENBC|nr:Protoporphyrinogen oxidase [Dendrothele bispora CBS 962.96]
MPRHHITILGGGISGLSSAFHLSRRFPDSLITLYEKKSSLGGWVSSERVQVRDPAGGSAEILLESGPRTLRPNAKSILELIHLLGLKDSIITTPKSSAAARNRYIQIPESQGLLTLPNSMMSVLSPPMRTLLLPHILKEPMTRANRPSGIADESLDSFMTRRFGASFARLFGSALVHGIYAADSRKLSVRATFPSLWVAEDRGWGSMVRGFLIPGKPTTPELVDYELGDVPDMMKDVSVFSFRDGMSTIINALAHHVERRPNVRVVCGTGIESLNVNDGGHVELRTTAAEVVHPDYVVSALPLPVLNTIITSSTASLPYLTANPSSSVTVINLVFLNVPGKPLHPPGFGYLIPRPLAGYSPENPGILGTVFDSCSLSAQDQPNRAPPQFAKMTMMLGGPYTITPSHVSLDAVLDRLRLHLTDPESDSPKVIPEPIFHRIHRHESCIPTPTPGHLERMAKLSAALSSEPWRGRLEVIGAGVRGVSLGDCVESGKRSGAK